MRARLWWIIALFCAVTIAATALLALLQPITGISVDVLELTRLAPAVGALVAWLTTRTMPATRALLPAPVPRGQWVAHALLGVGAGVLFAATLAAVTLMQAHPVGAALAIGAPFLGLVAMQAVGAFAEEVGWRGLLQPVLESRVGRLGASALVGLVWGLWHVQAFARPVVGLVFLAGIVALSVLLGHLASGSVVQRVTTAGIVHWLVNVATMLAGGDIAAIDGVTAWAIAAVGTAAVLMTAFVIATRKRAATPAATR